MNQPTILHIEDDSNDVLLLQHASRKAGGGFTLQTVSDGDEALAYLTGVDKFSDRQQYPLPRIVLLDLKMPRVNGFEVLTWIRGNPAFKCLPVVVLTSSNHEADVRRAYELGANSYLVKPVGFDSLVDVLKAIENYWLKLNERAD